LGASAALADGEGAVKQKPHLLAGLLGP
jgi:hypothetical protein